jgi:hypothetical protein
MEMLTVRQLLLRSSPYESPSMDNSLPSGKDIGEVARTVIAAVDRDAVRPTEPRQHLPIDSRRLPRHARRDHQANQDRGPELWNERMLRSTMFPRL